jgi:hypothetical protein
LPQLQNQRAQASAVDYVRRELAIGDVIDIRQNCVYTATRCGAMRNEMAS